MAQHQGTGRRAGASAAAALETESPEAPGLVLDQIRSAFETFGLNGHQARVLVALFRLGPASPAQLARLAGVHRTSAYPVLQELRARGLAQQVPGQSALWTSSGRDEVLDLLRTAHEERLREVTHRIEVTRQLLSRAIPDAGNHTVPYVQIISSASHARSLYDRLLAEAEEEVLVLNRPPYSNARDGARADRSFVEVFGRDEVNPVVLAALGRGVSIRVLYEAASWEDPEAGSFRAAMAAYHHAGVRGRVVDDLPMKLVTADRRATLFALADPVPREVGFPLNLLVEHGGYAAYQTDAFEHRWATARPCPE
ncbi:MAG: TrmB family transcriptional regulator [Acidimicrobiales bacterium]